MRLTCSGICLTSVTWNSLRSPLSSGQEKKKLSGIIRGGNRRAHRCLDMDAEGWMLIEDVVNYLRENTSESWSVAEVLDVFKFDSKQRFAVRSL